MPSAIPPKLSSKDPTERRLTVWRRVGELFSTEPERLTALGVPAVLHGIIGFAKTLVIAGFVAFFCIRGFIFEPFKIPSSSMVPTLLVGDFLFVSKYAYGNRLPLTDHFFWQREPQRGDIVVFKMKESGLPGSFFGLGDTLFIKRLVGLPGDRLAFHDKTLFINGVAVPQEKIGTYPIARNAVGQAVTVDVMKETLPNGIEHAILNDPSQPFAVDEPGYTVAETTVPDGQYVMMGDNRDNSRDSRFWAWPGWGYVPKKDLMGRAEFIFWSWQENWTPRLERIGLRLRDKPGTFRGPEMLMSPQD